MNVEMLLFHCTLTILRRHKCIKFLINPAKIWNKDCVFESRRYRIRPKIAVLA